MPVTASAGKSIGDPLSINPRIGRSAQRVHQARAFVPLPYDPILPPYPIERPAAYRP